MAKDSIEVPMGYTGGGDKPNTDRPMGSSKHGANFQYSEPDGHNKVTCPDEKKANII